MTYGRGDWVVFDNGCRREVGRVWRMGEKVAFVCYRFGCTASATPLAMLKPYDRDEDGDLVPDMRIGFHRFEKTCPVYDPMVCGDCDKEGEGR